MNRSIHVVILQDDKENKAYDVQPDDIMDEQHLDEHVSLVLLSRLNDICLKLTKNIDLLIRTPLACGGVASLKQSHPVQRQGSNASSISKQSTDEMLDTSNNNNNNVYDEIIEKLNQDLSAMRDQLVEQELRTYVERCRRVTADGRRVALQAGARRRVSPMQIRSFDGEDHVRYAREETPRSIESQGQTDSLHCQQRA